MNEKVLDTLMHLFALVAKEDGVVPEEAEVIQRFLYSQLSDKVAKAYFDRFMYYAESTEQVTVQELCERVIQDLTAKQKYYILIRLLELIGADEVISPLEVEVLRQTAQGLNIPEEEYRPLYDFVTSDKPRQLLSRNLLIISSSIASLRGAHLELENFVGYIAVLHLDEPDLYVLRYFGNGEPTLNGLPLVSGAVNILTPGSVIRAPRVQAIYFSDVVRHFWEPSQRSGISFQAQELSYRFATGALGLNTLSLQEQSGHLVAIMGGSGAGKSTLLNVLNGSLKPTTGQVLINGVDVHRNPQALQGIIGHVAQDDLLIEELTVYDNLLFNARLCFDHTSSAQLHQQVQRTLDELGLQEIQNLTVGSPLDKKISGGQRKRLNIALELIREPAVLFVDEPTSGLSSRDSENVMDLLKELTLRGKLVFVVIHQPSSEIFKMFDRLLLLDLGGYVIYYGNPLEAVRYFKRAVHYAQADLAECPTCGNVNPEQIFNIIETRVVDEYGQQTPHRKYSPSYWNRFFTTAATPPIAAPTEEPIASNLKLPSKLRQLLIFLQRDVRSKLGNRAYMAINLLEAPLLALVLAYLLRYHSRDEATGTAYTLWGNLNLPVYMLTSILVGLFIGLTVSAEEILRDRKIRKREAFLHLSRHSYLLSKLALLFALAALQTMLYTWIGNSILELKGLNLSYWVMLFSITCFANLVGLNISATFDNAVTIYVLVPILLIPQIVLSGAMVPFHELNPSISSAGSVPLYGDLTASRWAYEALAVRQFKENKYEARFYTVDQRFALSDYKVNYWLPELRKQLAYLQDHYRQPQDSVQTTGTLRTLATALTQEMEGFAEQPPSLQALQAATFNEGIGVMVEQLLRRLDKYYSRELVTARQARDSVLGALRAQHVDPLALRNIYANERLAEAVTNKVETDKVVEVNHRLIPLSDPIYRPAKGQWGINAPFYSPIKYVGQVPVDTFWYNVLVLWLMSLGLYVALYLEVFRWLVRGLGTLTSRLAYQLRDRRERLQRQRNEARLLAPMHSQAD